MNDHGRADEPDTFLVDGSYLREQAGEAIRSFLAPLVSVYAAATGRRFSVSDERTRGRAGGRL